MAHDPETDAEATLVDTREPHELSTDELRTEIELLDGEITELEERIRDFTRRRDHLLSELQDRLKELEGFVDGGDR